MYGNNLYAIYVYVLWTDARNVVENSKVQCVLCHIKLGVAPLVFHVSNIW